MSHYPVVIRKPNTVNTVSVSVQANSERQAEKLAEVYFQERFGYWPAPELTEKVELSDIGRLVQVIGKEGHGEYLTDTHGDLWKISGKTSDPLDARISEYKITCGSGCDFETTIFPDGDGEHFIWDFV